MGAMISDSSERERHLLSIASNPRALTEKTRIVSDTHVEITFSADQEFMKKLTRLKEIWAHALPQATWQELIERMADIAIEKEDPTKKAERAVQRKACRSASRADEVGAFNSRQSTGAGKTDCNTSKANAITMLDNGLVRGRRRPPRSIVHAVWLRDSGQCSYVGPGGGNPILRPNENVEA